MNEGLIELYFRKFRIYLIPIAILCVSLFIVLQVLLPQIGTVGETNTKIQEKKGDIAKLDESYNALKALTDEDFATNLVLTESAVSPIKNVVNIYNNLINASLLTNVQLAKFSLKAGTIYDKNKRKPTQVDTQKLFFEGNVEFRARSVEDFKKMTTILHTTIPLVEIKSMTLEDESGKYELLFYYKPYNQAQLDNLKNSYDIKPITEKEKQTLKQLEEWSKTLSEN